MNFRSRKQDEPEINLIPFIDVLLVILIFLMLSTTYSKFTEMQLKLPVADTDAQRDYAKEIIVSIGADGAYSVNRTPVAGRSLESVAMAMTDGAKSGKDTVVIMLSSLVPMPVPSTSPWSRSWRQHVARV
jgi:biopolymer transport protein ExbD